MSIFDRIAKLWPRNSADSGGHDSESTEAPEITGGPIQLRRLSLTELQVAIAYAWEAGRSNTSRQTAENVALHRVNRFRKAESRRRAQQARANKKPAADPLQSSNVMESQK